MANCLVTKLKSVVDNDNLNQIGSIILKSKGDSGRFALNSVQRGKVKLITRAGTVYKDSGYTKPYPSIEAIDGVANVFIKEGDIITLEITNKYYLSALLFIGGKVECAFNNLMYANHLRKLTFLSIISKGKLEKLIESNLPYEVTNENPTYRLYGDVTFGGETDKFVTLDIYSDNNLVKVYQGDDILSFDGAKLLGTYNKTTKVWTYNS